MAKLVLTDAYVLVNAVNLSAWTQTVTLNYSAESRDTAAMSSTTHSMIGGLKDWSLTLELQNAYAAAEVDATIFPIVGTVVAIEVRPTSGARSATNPAYTGTGLVTSYSPVAGSVGDLAMTPVTIVAATPLSRLTS